jgi:hypothetical protein
VTDSHENLSSKKIAAWILLAIAFGIFASQVLAYFQARDQLKSPLIPKSLVDEVSIPHLYSAGQLFIFGLVALVFMPFKRYIFSVVISALGIIINLIGHQYALFWTTFSSS